MYKWLAYGNDGKHPQSDATFFQRREFCFTLDGDIFVRYQSFKDCQEMQTAIRDRCPAKIDIGPVYNVDPQRRAAYAASKGFLPQERELVFDIDLTDYDDVRTCGKEGHICTKCWPLMAAAVAILDRGLREDFGFEHILFVYSGRRGVHAWICDERARKLTDEQRAAVANYFAVYKGQEKGIAKLATSMEDHPAIGKAYKILRRTFEDKILPQQKLLTDPVHKEAILAYLPSEPVRAEIRGRWAALGDDDSDEGMRVNEEKWDALVDLVLTESAALVKAKEHRAARAMEKSIKDIVFAYTYPRLDMEVSKKMNHLLKAPFCVHPKTGKVCVPIDPADAWSFNPDTVCTVGGLLNQLNTGGKTSGAGNGDEKWKGTGMEKAVETFRTCFLDGLQTESKDNLTAKAREVAAAPTMAW
jgi:DNA primase small subunit